MNISSKILRDLFDESFTSILVNDEALHTRAVHFFETGQNISESNNYDFNWSLHIIQGAGHNLTPSE